MTRPSATYLKVLVPAAAIIAAAFIVEKLGRSYIETAFPGKRELNLAEQILASVVIWMGRWGRLAVTLLVPIAVLLALWLAHARPASGDRAAHRLGMAIACLRLLAILNLAISAASFVPGFLEVEHLPHLGARMRIAVAVIYLATAVAQEVAVQGIKRRRFWAWVLGLSLLVLALSTFYSFPLAALGLWGLLDRGSRKEFGLPISPEAPGPSGSGDGGHRESACEGRTCDGPRDPLAAGGATAKDRRFQIGDRVRISKEHGSPELAGRTGTVDRFPAGLSSTGDTVWVRLDVESWVPGTTDGAEVEEGYLAAI